VAAFATQRIGNPRIVSIRTLFAPLAEGGSKNYPKIWHGGLMGGGGVNGGEIMTLITL
jgi:hypothetical protein